MIRNELAGGAFVALGGWIDLARLKALLYLLAARDDELVAPAQLLSVERLVGTPPEQIRIDLAPCRHLGLFMGRNVLREHWPAVAQWLGESEGGRAEIIEGILETGDVMAKTNNKAPADNGEIDLTISPEQVCFIIIKAREYDAKEAVVEPDPGSNPSDDKDVEILEDYGDDPVVEEITAFIDAMSEDEQIDLVALAWLGRDDTTAADWPTVRAEAAEAHNARTAEYLLGTPNLGDLLEEGLTMLGFSCEDTEMGRL